MNTKTKKYRIITFGCQMNYSDSDRIASLLDSLGMIATKKEDEADLVVIISCSVRQMAEDRTYGKINKLAKKKVRPRIIATGCLVSDKIKNKLLRAEKFDVCLPIDKMIDIPKYLHKWKLIDQIPKDNFDHYLEIIPQQNSKFCAFLPIMTGCNNFCAYCAVPYTRGREISRPMESILAEAKKLAQAGCIELTLLGQNVNSYGADLSSDKKPMFVQLLDKISDINELQRIYFISSHPKDMSDDLIDLVARKNNLCKYIHLPVQSGDDTVLKNMNRHYTKNDYLKLADKIKKAIPDVVISTDVIVGFPGETKEQFANTCEVFEKVGFDMAFIAEYSPRPKSLAYNFKDDISRSEKTRRKKVLNDDYLAISSLANKKKLIGKVIPVLIKSKNKKNITIGFTQGLQQVHVETDENLIGKIVSVKIVEAQTWGLKGELV